MHLDDFGASEFGGGWLTGPLSKMADLGVSRGRRNRISSPSPGGAKESSIGEKETLGIMS
jgi:hypothetical protein